MSDSLGIAIVGAGKAGTNLGLAVRACPDAEVVRVMSRTSTSAKKLASAVGAKRYGIDLHQVLADGEVAAVMIATPDKFHCEQTVAAVRAGKHVLCEKPMCRSVPEAEAMIRAAEEARVTLMIGFAERFNQPCLEAKRRIDAGEIGRPVMILARRCHPKSLVRGRDWLNDNETGGILNYAGTHNIDLICWFMNSKPIRVFAEMGQLVLKGQNFTDCAVMTFRFENDGVATLYESFAYPDPYPHSVDRSIEILGTQGSLTVDLMRQPLGVHAKEGYQIADAITWPTISGEMGGAILAEVRHFVLSIREHKPVMTPGETGLRATRLAEAACEAFRTGRAVSV